METTDRKAERPVCPGCMRPCDGVCPRCGEHPEGLYIPHALAPGRMLGNEVILGCALAAGETSILYIGYDQRRKRRVLVEELFAPAHMVRNRDGTVCGVDGVLPEELAQYDRQSGRRFRRVLYDNNTVYRVGRYPCLFRRIRAKRAEISCFAWAEASLIGAREEQQDASRCCLGEDWIFAVLCDGMGGLPQGAVASQYCAERLVQALAELLEAEEAEIPQLLKALVRETDGETAALTTGDGAVLGCGTTLVCAFLRQERLYYASVGDSRLYLIRGTGILQLNREHNLRSRLIGQGEEGAAAHPQAEALTSYIGLGSGLEIDCVEKPCRLEQGDTLLLCSDGVYRTVAEPRLTELCSGSPSAAAAGIRREVEAKALPWQDNASCLEIGRAHV